MNLRQLNDTETLQAGDLVHRSDSETPTPINTTNLEGMLIGLNAGLVRQWESVRDVLRPIKKDQEWKSKVKKAATG